MELTCDLAIVAAGPAGLAAAITGAELGLEVLVFEKASGVGGTANMGMGPFGVESRFQKERMVGLTKEEAFEKFMDYTHWSVDARLVRDYFWKSGSTIDWLEDMGVKFAEVIKYYPDSESTWHVVQPEGGGVPGPRAASTMTKIMHQRAQELGVTFYFDTPVTKILRAEEGWVTGLQARGADGTEYEVEAAAVVLATGGFGNNPEMIQTYCGYTWGQNMLNFRIPGITGDGIRMAWEAGAAKGHMEMEQVLGTALSGRNDSFLSPAIFKQASALIVNLSGERIMNEAIIENGAVSCNAVARQQNKWAYSILDDEMIRHFQREGLDFASGVHRSNPAERFDAEFESMKAACPDGVFSAGHIRELAEQIGIDPDALEATLETYNQCCDLHYDDYFCKPRRYLRALRGKTLYALKLVPGGYGSLGGVRIDSRFRILDEAYHPIPGFYGAGSDVCDLYAGTYMYYLPGNTMGFALNSGRLAAEHALEYINEAFE